MRSLIWALRITAVLCYPRTHHCAGWVDFRTRSQHHPRPTAGSSRFLFLFLSFSLSPFLSTYEPLCLLIAYPTLVHIAPHVPPLSYPNFMVIGARFSRFTSSRSCRKLGAKPSTYTTFRRHGGTRAVLGTRAVWTGCLRMDRLYRYPLQRTTGNSQEPGYHRRIVIQEKASPSIGPVVLVHTESHSKGWVSADSCSELLSLLYIRINSKFELIKVSFLASFEKQDSNKWTLCYIIEIPKENLLYYRKYWQILLCI